MVEFRRDFTEEKAYAEVDELVEVLSKRTGVKPEAVREILRASFPSTKAYILRESRKALAEQEVLVERLAGCIGDVAR